MRNNESINARLEKTLRLAESDNQKLVSELKANSEDVKRAENKLRSLNNQINEVDLDYRNVVAQAEKFKAESGANAAGLNNEIAKGK